MRISNDGPEVFSSYASLKSRRKITVWMPWPLNCDLGGGAMWPSNHFRLYTAHCICTEAQETRAPCMFDWQGTQTPATQVLPLWNAKSQIRSLVCTLHNSNIAITSLVCTLRNSNCAIRMIIQITHCALVWNSLCWLCDHDHWSVDGVALRWWTSTDQLFIITQGCGENERKRKIIITDYRHSCQDCPIDFHMLHSELFHDHEIVPPTISWLSVRYASVYII